VSGTVEKVHVYWLSCPLDAGGLPFIWLKGVPANASLTYLQQLVSAKASAFPHDGIASAREPPGLLFGQAGNVPPQCIDKQGLRELGEHSFAATVPKLLLRPVQNGILKPVPERSFRMLTLKAAGSPFSIGRLR
jgi:hypothetical protein